MEWFLLGAMLAMAVVAWRVISNQQRQIDRLNERAKQQVGGAWPVTAWQVIRDQQYEIERRSIELQRMHDEAMERRSKHDLTGLAQIILGDVDSGELAAPDNARLDRESLDAATAELERLK